MLKQFYKNERFEEMMGLVGVLYIVVLCFAGALLVKFLVGVTTQSLVPSPITGSSIPQYDIAAAQKL